MTNSADPDQLASSEANWSGSTLFAKTGHVVLSKRRVIGRRRVFSRIPLVRSVYPFTTLQQSSLTIHWAYSADDRLMVFSYFVLKNRVDISCELSPKGKFQSLVSGKNKNYFKMLSAETFPSILSVNDTFPIQQYDNFSYIVNTSSTNWALFVISEFPSEKKTLVFQ